LRKIRVLLADDYHVVRRGARVLLEQAPDLLVVTEAGSSLKVLPLVMEAQPEVLLLDMLLPGLSGAEVARQLKTVKSPVRILGFSAHADAHFIRTLMQNGAAGYLLKDEVPTLLVEAVRSIAQGEQGWYSRQATTKMGAWLQQDVEQPQALTARELDVLAQLVSGKTNHKIAAALEVSEKTVEKHLHSVFVKFDASSRVEAAAYAVQKGLV
jgi:DNA-binding NarL/FixJ family response regulator